MTSLTSRLEKAIGATVSKATRELTELAHFGQLWCRDAFNSNRLAGEIKAGTTGQLCVMPVVIRDSVKMSVKLRSSLLRSPIARTTSHFSVICLTRYGRIVALSTRLMTTFVMPLAANDFAISTIISSA